MNTIYAHTALLVAQVIYAISFVVAKDFTADWMEPAGLVVLRAAGASLLFWFAGTLFVREKTDRKDLPRLLMLAVFGVCINQMLFLKGLDLTSPIHAAIMMITTPILVLILAALIIRERITMVKAAGVLLGFLGAAALMYSGSGDTKGVADPLGDFFVLLNATSWGLYLVLVKPLMQKYHTVTILKWVFLFGAILVLPFGVADTAVDYSAFSRWAWGALAFIIIGTTFIAYLLNTFALKALSPSVVSAYIYLQPVLTAIIAVGLGKDHLDLGKVLSALCIFTGVYLVSVRKPA
ncbi:MAG: EamA family transporter [Bacteroidia bacterium]|nr:EamA family transporter [Bacteroidia bacterium]